MKWFKILIVAGLILNLSGCVTLSSGEVVTKKLGSFGESRKEVTILNSTPHLSDMTIALVNSGFSVKPMPSQKIITERSGDLTSQYNLVSTRYGLFLEVTPTRQICAFTDYRIVNATINIIDTRTNESVAILKQRGSDGPCTTVTPVFQTLADEMSRIWN